MDGAWIAFESAINGFWSVLKIWAFGILSPKKSKIPT